MQIQNGPFATLGDETSRLQQGPTAPQTFVAEWPYSNDEDVDAQRTCNADLVATFDHDRLPRRDGLPEHTTYRDTGCTYAPACLDCPLDRCRYEPQPSRQQRIVELRRGGMSVPLVAQALGVSRRTVFRLTRAAA